MADSQLIDNDLFAPPPAMEGREQNRAGVTSSVPPQPGVGAAGIDLFAPPPVEGGPGLRGASDSAEPSTSLFDPPPVQSEYDKLRTEMDRGIVESIKESPGMKSKAITDAELQTIAQKHGVQASELRDWMPYFLGTPGDENIRLSDVPKFVAGTAGAVLGNIPQKLAKKTQTPEMERALDDVQELANRRLSLLGAGATMLAPAAEVGKAAGLGTKLAAGAATGAGYGFGGSRQGHEVMGTAVGAGLGLGLSGVAAGVGRWWGNRAAGRAAEAAESEGAAAVDRVVERGGADFREGVEHEIDGRSDADQIIRQHVFGEAEELSPDQARIVAEAYQPHMVAELTDTTNEVGSQFVGRLRKANPSVTAEEIQNAATREVADTVVRNSVGEFARDVFKRPVAQADDPRAMLRSWAGQAERSGQGVEYASERMQGLLNARTAEQYVRNRGISQTRGPSIAQKGLDWLSDAQYVLRGMDEKWRGLDAEGAHKLINQGVNRMSFPREDMRQQISGIFRRNRKAGVDADAISGSEIIRKVEAGEQLSEAEEKAFSGFRSFFSDNLERLNKLADEDGVPKLAIKSRPNYVPAQLVDSSRLRDIISDRVNTMVREAEQLDGRRYLDIAEVPVETYRRVQANPANRETVQFMHMLSGEEGTLPADVSRMWKQTFLNPEGRQRLETVARAALEREDSIPLWARETNLYKLADKWTTSTLRHLYLRQGIDKLRNVSHMLHNLNADSQAQYVERLLADLMGTRKGTAAEYFTKAQDSFHTWADRRIRGAGSDYEKAALQTVKMVPTMLQDMAKQVYPNLLGALNPRTLITNLTQTFTKTLPEFGTPYGTLLFLRGAARIGGVRNLPKYMRRMEAMGLAPRRYVGNSLDYLDEGLARSGLAQVLKRGTRGVAEIGMKPYEWAETVNRGIAFGASEMMANDLLRGSKLAESALMRMPSAVRTAVDRARADGDVGEMVRQIATHVVNSTQYQYNRASMSEYGRTMGPLFSTFSKWPTATLGQVVEGYRSHGPVAGTGRLAEQLVAPWLLLEGADYLMGQYSDEGLTDRQKKLFSSQGLSQAAPIGTLKGIATGDFFTPPAVDTALKLFLQPTQAQDSEKAIDGMRKAAESGLYMFAPGGMGGWIRFVTDDLATLATGERPEGDTQVQRAGLDPFGRNDE